MDDVVVDALRYLGGQLSDPLEFFQAVRDDHEENKDSGFDAFRSAFEARGFGAAGEELVRYLDDNGRLELVTKVVEHRPEELVAAYVEQVAAGEDGPESGADDPGTAAAWQALLAEYSGYWDGDEANWAAFEQYVVYYATEQGLAGPAQRFFERAAAEDKPALFAEYGVALRFESAGAAESVAAEAQEALWQAAIGQFGSFWAAWDGTDLGWVEYRDWFYEATNSQDPDMYALAYERLQPLDELAPDERITRLRDLGFDVSGTETPQTPETPQATADERAASVLAAAEDPALEGVNREELDQLLNDPDFDQRMTDAGALVDAALEDALSEVESS